MEAQLGRRQRRHQRRVVGEDADFADLGAGRDLLDFAVEDLPLRGEDLDVDHVLRGHGFPYAAAAALAFSVTWSIEPCM